MLRDQGQIRSATRSEIAEIEELGVAAYDQYRSEVLVEIFDAYVQDLRSVDAEWAKGEVLVFDCGDRLAGTVIFYPDATLEGLGLPHGWAGFRKLAVHPDMRGRGVGRALVNRCIEMAREKRLSTIGIHTANFMKAACSIYEEVGFRRSPEHDLRASDIVGSAADQGNIAVIAYRLDFDARMP